VRGVEGGGGPLTCMSSPQSVPFLAHWWGPRVQSLIAAPVVDPVFDPNLFREGASGTFNGLWPHPEKIPEQKLPCLKFFLRGYQFVLGQRDFVDVTKGTLQKPNAPTFPFWIFLHMVRKLNFTKVVVLLQMEFYYYMQPIPRNKNDVSVI